MLYRSRELNNLTSVVIVILHDDYTIYTNRGLITNISRIIFAKKKKSSSLFYPNLHSISTASSFFVRMKF